MRARTFKLKHCIVTVIEAKQVEQELVNRGHNELTFVTGSFPYVDLKKASQSADWDPLDQDVTLVSVNPVELSRAPEAFKDAFRQKVPGELVTEVDVFMPTYYDEPTEFEDTPAYQELINAGPHGPPSMTPTIAAATAGEWE